MTEHASTMPELVLVDQDRDVVEALQRALGDPHKVRVLHGDILTVAECCVVSPANSAGFMDGGIDRHYVDFFGLGLQERVMDAINGRYAGAMPVGAGMALATGHAKIPYLIVAPTMVSPGPLLDARPCGMAMMAILQAAWRNRRSIRKVFCPALGTGVGELSPRDAAHEMRLAYERWLVFLSAQ